MEFRYRVKQIPSAKTFSYEQSSFFNPWMVLWERMVAQARALDSKFSAGEESPRYRQLRGDIKNLVDWMKKREPKDRIAKVGIQWWKITYYDTTAFTLAVKLFSYYRDLWELVQHGGDSIDAAYRCIDFVREFPERISWDMEEAQKKCRQHTRKDIERNFSKDETVSMAANTEEDVYVNIYPRTSLDDESGLVVA